jgi:hypothetical protein
MTSEPAISPVSVLWSCCQHLKMYLLWILDWLHIGSLFLSLRIDLKLCLYSQEVSKRISLHLLLRVSHPTAFHASHHYRIGANLTWFI